MILQLWCWAARNRTGCQKAAETLFRRSVELGWDEAKGGFFYTLDWPDKPAFRFNPWWPIAEAAGAGSFLVEHRPRAFHEQWCRRIWNTIAVAYIDREHGGRSRSWMRDCSRRIRCSARPTCTTRLQACVTPLYPAQGSLTNVISKRHDDPPTKIS
ncbi:AGE family epimerase/isomerase [Mesorhizobium sp. BR115XR7A]|uniref:AGE family epimerase/isomerase n=1 Tax=Mesorhizobium sp. BR115XR7A TaxID=2876645 RepID=UPI001CD00C11|nr:AGE family epimerase/isomerase [Mesorhizobium sp. BR115XR7A]MBZ9930402.1 AGE family epimerase/isomerase [Mesorhizobium sp. BR1-1-5]